MVDTPALSPPASSVISHAYRCHGEVSTAERREKKQQKCSVKAARSPHEHSWSSPYRALKWKTSNQVIVTLIKALFKEFQMPYFFKSFHALFSKISYFVSHQAVNLKLLRICCCKLPFCQLAYLAMFVVFDGFRSSKRIKLAIKQSLSCQEHSMHILRDFSTRQPPDRGYMIRRRLLSQ